MNKSTLFLLISAFAFASVSTNADTTIPAELPPVDQDAPLAKDKPVKVYILSGQSNMLGFGRIEGDKPLYSRLFFSPDPTAKNSHLPARGTGLIRMGVFQGPQEDAKKGGIAHSKSFQGALALGSTAAELPKITDGEEIQVEAYLEVPVEGSYEVNVGLDTSSYAVARVDGQEVYRKGIDATTAEITPVKLEKGKRHKLNITYFKSGSLALWLEQVNLKSKGDLRWVVEDLGKFTSLMNDKGEWVARPDVMHTDAYMGKGNSAPLSAPACGRAIGPELGFGWVMGEFHDEPVIVMKADIGNRSLGWDILPPGTERYTFDGKTYPGYREEYNDAGEVVKWDGGKGWYAGRQYDEYTESVHAVLNNFAENFPQYADQGFEVAGFVWWQGHKDGPNPAHNARYEKHLANLIKAWRKEFKAPEASWTIATVGFGGADMADHYTRIAQAQLNVADPELYPEFAGNVKTIDARPFWRPAGMSPKNQDYHYNHNAETYMLVGDALGRAMVELKGGQVVYPDGEVDPSIGSIPDLAWLTGAQTDSMQPALKPIMLDGIIPGWLEQVDRTPAYLRYGMAMSTILKNEAPESTRRKNYQVGSQYDLMVQYYNLAGVDTYSWKTLYPDALNKEWQYFSYDPKNQPDQDTKIKIRYREVDYPDGMGDWYAVDFDPAQLGWKTGKAPFGQKDGKLEPIRNSCDVSYCLCDMMPNTFWENEVLLARTKLQIPEFDPNYRYRIVVGGAGHKWSGEGYALYINGELVNEMKDGFYKNGGDPRGFMLYNDFLAEHGGKEINIALKGFLRMSGHKTKEAPPSGHLNVWVQRAKLPEMLLERAAVASGE